MSCKFLDAHQDGAGNLVYRVWLDTTKGTEDNPTPAYVRDYLFAPEPDGWSGATLDGTSYDTYSDYITAEVKALATHEAQALADAADPTDLTAAGSTF